ncbi:MAG TPA: hypothetical protein DEB17_10300 [Chlorobaculum sp.]|uniref:Uncharacterized protein n=1 Tax=Chlorobaculum tepidum (strain ATCC 49652 / DSM 12025 / NBRC 103806 / TLS) TaxID=194439 RepID=Q8KG67_CHLTE|nr:hypothetical protein CT0101 [Chlorobaculum tepidum TLS]HBU24359.1 hypothetical protein [Chlorobaculum sp.]
MGSAALRGYIPLLQYPFFVHITRFQQPLSLFVSKAVDGPNKLKGQLITMCFRGGYETGTYGIDLLFSTFRPALPSVTNDC